MAQNKIEDSQVYNSNPEDELSYRELSNTFNDMYVDSINAFKEIYLQKEIILKLEKKINDLNRALYSLKEAHKSLVTEFFNVSDTLVEKLEKVECPTLKCGV